MTRTEIFAYLGAPLSNSRWSWGAVRPPDGAVFLRVWEDENRTIGGRHYTRVDAASFIQDESGSPGYTERLRHLDLIRAGAASYMVMCRAADKTSHPRKIASFNQREVFVGGKLVEDQGDWWLERAARKPLEEVLAR